MFSGAASAIKNRLRFNHGGNSAASEAAQLTSSKSTPDLSSNSVFKEPVSSSLHIRKIRHGFEDDDDNIGQSTSSTNSLTRSFEFNEDPTFWEDHSVQVIIRIRPLNSSELSVQGQSRCVRQDCSQSITWTGNPESRFTFDHVADEHVSQEMLFKVAGVPMVENTVGGYNSCMFAYGQTGSGKTHTMLGDIEEGTRRHSVNCGMTPRVFEYLFSRIQKEKEVRREEKIRFTSRCSFLEIYNEHILDLLDPSSTNLQIREDTKKGVYVENLTEVEVTSARDVIQQLVQGAANRKVAATNMNRASSRSHSVFTCVVESKWESQGVTHHRFSRLNLVDLAGSERQKSSGAEGERLKEATNINKSLSTLGLVIMNLVNMSNGKSLHVPYRDSKLTFLLQDSLGGNAKTIIIANISPSSSCSLETLSTLKFAQRAKFIKNNAIVNEDASGDVLAMRAQIQNLKKEVARLRSLANGGADNHEDDSCLASIAGTPGPFKWDGLNDVSTPLTKPHKKSSQNEYEIALVGAFRREKDKDIAIQTLTSENQAALQLTKQREDEIQGLKMRLRFREAAIKRLEAVASGKISAETHLLKEKEDHLKEIDVLRTEVACNPEVTRFAMENLRVKEEIRRLKSFYEEGERERMMEQITMLQNKLLEALDWKLMHEPNLSTVQKERFKPGMDIQDDGFLLNSGQGSPSPWRTTVNEENEFLRMQAIHNQSELDALHRRLDLCVDEKEKLESHVKDLEAELDARSRVTQESSVVTNNLMSGAVCDQVELKTMVDAIATASEREAEAHETAITLSKENDQLRMKLKVLLDDNNKLIELYERTVSENQTSNESPRNLDVTTEADNLKQQTREMHEENDRLMALYEKAAQKELDATAEAGNLNQQLAEMHEENDRLMALYEKAAQKELDVTTEARNLKQQLMELHEENDKLMGLYEKAMQDRVVSDLTTSAAQKELDVTTEADNLKQQITEMHEENDRLMALYEKAAQKELDATAEAGNLKQQLMEIHEENDRLMALYEKAAQKELDVTAQAGSLKQQLVELHEENDKLMGLYEKAMQERDVADLTTLAAQKELDVTTEADNVKQQITEMHEEKDRFMALYEKAAQKELDITAEAGNLKQQLMKLHEEYDKLMGLYVMGLYEKAMQETAQKELDVTTEADNLKQQITEMHEENDRLMGLYEKAAQKELDITAEAGNLKLQLMELHEETDKSMGLYEKAMQETDESRMMLVSAELKHMDIQGELNCPEKLVEIDGESNCPEFSFTEARSSNVEIISENESKSTNLVEVRVFEDVNLIRRKLLEAQEKLSNSALSLNVFSSLEKAIQEVDELSREIKNLDDGIQVKQESFESCKHLSLVLQERRAVLDKKLIALKYSISNFVSSVGYFGNREAQARARYNSSVASINKKKEELAHLEICKGEIVDSQSTIKQSETELKNNLAALKVRLEEENRRLEKERVLVAIDNVEKTDVVQTNWQLTGKATDLLKSEEEIPKLRSQIKKMEEKHAVMRKDINELDRKAASVENDIKMVQERIRDGSVSAEEMNRKLQSITQEKEMVLVMQAEGRKELKNMIHEYYECVFEAAMREEETKILDEDVQIEVSKLRRLQNSVASAVGRKAELMEAITCQSCFVSDKIEEDLYCVNRFIMEVNSMLGDFDSNSNDS